jgi:ADP-heptose:LPS heptosyltransferase
MRILVQRFSALGDIVLLLPILQALKKSHPRVEIAFLSRPFAAPLIQGLDLQFIGADLTGAHKGFWGLKKLSGEIMHNFDPDLIIDAHSVLRSKVLNSLFRLRGVKVFSLKKDRRSRKLLLTKGPEAKKHWPTMSELHLDTFKRAGFHFPFDRNNIPKSPFELKASHLEWWAKVKKPQNIGIAPKAKHRSKQWPREKFLEVMRENKDSGICFFLFGGPEEQKELQSLGEESGACFELVAGKFSLDQELGLMKKLDLVLALDSSNMHLAAWSGTKVVSIWGGTHPSAGFAPYENELNMISLSPKLNCMPCSVFGKGQCHRGDWACMQKLSVKNVQSAIQENID